MGGPFAGGGVIFKQKLTSKFSGQNVLGTLGPKIRLRGADSRYAGGLGCPPPQATPGKNLRRPPTRNELLVVGGGLDHEVLCCKDPPSYGRIFLQIFQKKIEWGVSQ